MKKPKRERIEYLKRSLQKCQRLLRALQAAQVQEFQGLQGTEAWLAIPRAAHADLQAKLATPSKEDLDRQAKALDSQADLSTIRETLRVLEDYNGLAQKVRDLQVWDFTLYDRSPGPDWLAVRRADYEEIMQELSQFDLWEPWNTTIQRRLG